ncbi:hypothetical protein [Bacillus piscicola]|uniref:hypothetical protein n=1 Tax=Bacillus piscicola TaxID=1632684 RepID=UPI001F08A836|nr:hypothetical protein [Bacillus piscicola]
MKFKKGEKVQVKQDLVVNVNYYNETTGTSDVFSHRMLKFRGKEAFIEEVSEYGYTLNIDRLHVYTDTMLQYPTEPLTGGPSQASHEVERIVQHFEELGVKQIIDKALDERLYEKDTEAFLAIIKQNKTKN